MKLHWGKTQAISIGTAERLQTPDGQIIQENGSLKYLGGMLYDTGRIEAEISQKLGTAAADFGSCKLSGSILPLASRGKWYTSKHLLFHV